MINLNIPHVVNNNHPLTHFWITGKCDMLWYFSVVRKPNQSQKHEKSGNCMNYNKYNKKRGRYTAIHKYLRTCIDLIMDKDNNYTPVNSFRTITLVTLYHRDDTKDGNIQNLYRKDGIIETK
jgi:hypothetical protein